MRTIVAAFLAILPFVSVMAQEMAWGCYDPQPGHPTQAERQAFVERLRPMALQVQAEFNVPKAGILAMAIQESGYGWTRTAMHANNLFGWKFGNSARAEKLRYWTLECQPLSDPGKNYAVFSNWEESMRFVAKELSKQARYAKATLAAGRAISAKIPEKELTEAWLRAIQKAGYNPDPRYPDDVLRVGREAGVFSVWTGAASQESDAASTGATSPMPAELPTAEQLKVLAWFRTDDSGRYMINGAVCTSENAVNWPGYETLPNRSLQRCQYFVASCKNLKGAEKITCESKRTVSGPKQATVVLLEPGLERFARWIVSACAEVGGDRSRCLRQLYREGVSAGNWQIPIAGIVFEDMPPQYVQYGYAFRDGLTVRADASCGWLNGSRGERSPSREENEACSVPRSLPQGISNKVRPMSTTRSELVAWHSELAARLPEHEEQFPVVGESAQQWRNFVRETLVASCASDHNPLVTAKAFALRRQGKF
jgi:hypothetical protein